jgi:hypothetical protein
MAAVTPVKKIDPADLRRTIRALQVAVAEPALQRANQRRAQLTAEIKSYTSTHDEDELMTNATFNALKLAREEADHAYFDPLTTRFPNFVRRFPSVFQAVAEHIMTPKDMDEFLDAYERWYSGALSFEDMSRMGISRMERAMGKEPGYLSRPPPSEAAAPPPPKN